jgi:hypothetical protein
MRIVSAEQQGDRWKVVAEVGKPGERPAAEAPRPITKLKVADDPYTASLQKEKYSTGNKIANLVWKQKNTPDKFSANDEARLEALRTHEANLKAWLTPPEPGVVADRSLAAEREFLLGMGGFDMMFMGGHEGEDQQLGRRMMERAGQSGVFIHEPPFAWHPTEPEPYVRGDTNLCPEAFHKWDVLWYNEVKFRKCENCPAQTVLGKPEDARLVMPYEHSRVQLQKEFIE